MANEASLKKRLAAAKTKEERAAILDGLSHDVGFGRPPVHTRFGKGNKAGRGRAKGSKNFSTILNDEFDAPAEVTENGKKRKLPKGQIALRQLANKAAAGDMKALGLYVQLLGKAGQLAEQPVVQAPPLDQRDLAAVERVDAMLALSEPTAAVATDVNAKVKRDA